MVSINLVVNLVILSLRGKNHKLMRAIILGGEIYNDDWFIL